MSFLKKKRPSSARKKSGTTLSPSSNNSKRKSIRNFFFGNKSILDNIKDEETLIVETLLNKRKNSKLKSMSNMIDDDQDIATLVKRFLNIELRSDTQSFNKKGKIFVQKKKTYTEKFAIVDKDNFIIFDKEDGKLFKTISLTEDFFILNLLLQ